MRIMAPTTETTLFEQSTQSTPLLITLTTALQSSRSQSIITPTLLLSANLNTEVSNTFSTDSSIETTSTTTSFTTAILIGVIVVLFVVMALGGITCVGIILIQKRKKAFNPNNTTKRRTSFPENVEVKETDVNREYERVEDYMNMSSTAMESHGNDISLVQNQAYASVHHPQ